MSKSSEDEEIERNYIMRHFKALALSTVAVLSLGVAGAQADTGAPFTSHHLVEAEPYEAFVEKMPAEEKLEIREYLDYEQREPCQFYQPLPNGFVRQGCDIMPRQIPVKTAVVEKQVTTRTVKREVLADYEVHFAFDKANIEPEAAGVLDRVASEIKKYKPGEVTVSGHADRSGPADYNMELSQRRAQAVSNALTARGVVHRVIEEEAHGEYEPEVPTPDGVRNAANRRVEIQFLK